MERRSSSMARRRAWINSSRHRSTQEELDPVRPLSSLPSTSISDDDVFSDGCFTGKIENWLQGCGSENARQLSFESVLRSKDNAVDDLSLGADAFVYGGEVPRENGSVRQFSWDRRHSRISSSSAAGPAGLCLPSLYLGHSMASNSSSSTLKTTSSVSEVLHMCSEDPEETLLELGFGTDEPQPHVRIPTRFFTFPSQAQGINFRLFLDSQLRRIREEDPSLSLASRFRQVQALTAMANAFYSLYSHVSRTPLQKLPPPEFSLSSPVEKLERFRSSVRSEPRSPVERLKDTVSKMCLYTGSPRGSDSTSPQPSPRRQPSLPDVVDLVLEKTKKETARKLDLGESCNVDIEKGAQLADDDRSAVPLSEETVAGTDWLPSRGAAHDSRALQSDKDEIKPVAKVTYDEICQQIEEHVHQASPFCYRHTHTPKTNPQTELTHQPCIHVTSSDTNPGEGPAASSLPPNASDYSHASNHSPVQTREAASNNGKTSYLNPPTAHQGLRPTSSDLTQVNSFELEEVHSAGEEDLGQSVAIRAARNWPKCPKDQSRGEAVRGDSVQSDSSGYADEEVSSTLERHGK